MQPKPEIEVCRCPAIEGDGIGTEIEEIVEVTNTPHPDGGLYRHRKTIGWRTLGGEKLMPADAVNCFVAETSRCPFRRVLKT